MVVLMETTLRLVFDELQKVVESQTIHTARFKTLLNRLDIALKSIEPVFSETWRLSKVLDRPQSETTMFISYLKKGKRLVLKSSGITFHNACQKFFHRYKLIRLNNELVRFFQTELQVKNFSSKRNSIAINDVGDKMDQVLSGCFAPHLIIDSNSLSDHAIDEFPVVEELTLNIENDSYSLPESFKRMGKLKVLSIIGYTDYPSKLHNLSFLDCLSNLTKIRFEHVSISSVEPIFASKNLKQLSFVMCEIADAFMSYTTQSPHMLITLTELEFDTCSDLKQLPSELCNLVHLQKLTITNCHELDSLPKGLGGLPNLEMLSLRCCTKLRELPESIGSLHNLKSIDISDCLSISALPEEIGELSGLRVLKMSGCGGLQELPASMSKLGQLEQVICDEETSYLWMEFESDLPDLKINVAEDDRLESLMKVVQ